MLALIDGAHGPSVFGAEVVGLDLELLHRVRRQLDHLVGEALVASAVGVVVDAVQDEVVERGLHAVDIERGLAAAVGQAGTPHAGRQQRQIGVVASVQRQIDDGVAGR